MTAMPGLMQKSDKIVMQKFSTGEPNESSQMAILTKESKIFFVIKSQF